MTGLAMAVLFAISSAGSASEQINADVVVYGDASGGVAAAVQSARMGKSVVLVSQYGHLGGMTSSGLGWTDMGNAAILGGISREFYHRAYLHYQDDAAWDMQTMEDFGNQGQGGPAFDDDTQLASVFEPKVAEAIFEQLAAETGVHIVTGRLDFENGVVKNGSRIQSLQLEDGQVIIGSMFVDASYEGDLLAAAGVSFRRGRESNAEFSESGNGITGARGGNQLPDGIDPYVIPGDSQSGLLPGVNADMGGAVGDADHRIQAYCYRMVLTDIETNRVLIAQPAGYDEDLYEILFRAIDAGQSTRFFKTNLMPNRKTDSNNASGISCDFIGMNYGSDWDWTTLSHGERETVAAQHRDWQLGLVWTLQNHSRVPQSIRDSLARWGLPADEFTDNGNWPYNIYVREGRRMVSDFVMTEDHCRRILAVDDPVGMGAYTMDSHNTQRFVSDGMVKNEGDIQMSLGGTPYPISYRALIPSTGECENLIVPWALSASHIAFGSIRMEPVFMVLGQSAGTACALAMDDGVVVQDLDYGRLSQQLLADGMILAVEDPESELDDAVMVDSEDASAVLVGSWPSSTSIPGYNGTGYFHDENAEKGTKSVLLTPDLPEAGNYKVYLVWTSNNNRALNVPVTVSYQGGSTNLTVNQKLNGGEWVLLGMWPFSEGTAGTLLMETGGTDGYVIVDSAAWDLQ